MLPEDLLKEAIPGNIRKAEHFVAFLKRFVEYLKVGPYPIWLGRTLTGELADTYASFACGRGDPSLILAALEGHYVHRTETSTVSGAECAFMKGLSSSCDRFCAERLQSLVRTLELSRLDEFSSLQKVASWATLVATYEKGVP